MYTGKMKIEFKFEGIDQENLDGEIHNALESLRQVGEARITESKIAVDSKALNKEYLEM
jgi:hypothetical protein